LRDLFFVIKDDLTYEPESEQAGPAAALQKMADEQASEIARRILRLHYELEEWLDAFRNR
jgi:hypothetical protein